MTDVEMEDVQMDPSATQSEVTHPVVNPALLHTYYSQNLISCGSVVYCDVDRSVVSS